MPRLCTTVFLATLLFAPFSLTAGQIVIDFEGFPDSTVLTSQYAGLTFTNAIILTAGISLNEFEFPPHSGVNVASDNGGPMSIDFASSVSSFGGYFTYGIPLTLDAFDVTNTLVASVTSIFSNNEALSGDPGSSPNEFIQVSFPGGISGITITAGQLGSSFALDDAVYTIGTGTPEPSTFLLSLPLFLILYWLRGPSPNDQHKKPPITLPTMKKSFTSLGTLILLMGVGAALLYAGQHKPAGWPPAPQPTTNSPSAPARGYSSSASPSAVGAPIITPGAMLVNTVTPITVTSKITDPTVISTSVNLLQVNVSGNPTILGQLHDDGKNGDQVAGDGVFTIVLNLKRTTIAQVTLQVSAAFNGQIRRVVSVSSPLGVIAASAPPGFQVNADLLAASGPVSVNNFANQYQHGGLVPPGGADMDITSIPVPPPPLSNFIAYELQGATITSTSAITVSGISCTEEFYTESYGTTYSNIAVYCPATTMLYKAYLSYHAGDPSESRFLTAFQTFLNSVQFP